MRPLSLLALLLVLPLAAPAPQPDPEVITSVSPSDVERMLREEGYEYQKLDSRTPMYRILIDHRPVVVMILGDNNSTLMFRTTLEERYRASLSKALQWNQAFRFIKAYLSDSGELVIEYDQLLSGGVSRTTMAYGLVRMLQAIGIMRQEFPRIP
jgi:hypothetical protein